ncbi:hypothetical protein C8R43DRAFT_955996 [Mycena crocata]|nr:hypothetical protein C8R43DRAFT_955996 [Mycena crocata]
MLDQKIEASVVEAGIFNKNTFSWIPNGAGIETAGGATYKAFVVFIGALLEELGYEILEKWFVATFGPLVTVAEEAFMKEAARIIVAVSPSYRWFDFEHVFNSFSDAGVLKNVRAKQPSIRRKESVPQPGQSRVQSLAPAPKSIVYGVELPRYITPAHPSAFSGYFSRLDLYNAGSSLLPLRVGIWIAGIYTTRPIHRLRIPFFRRLHLISYLRQVSKTNWKPLVAIM